MGESDMLLGSNTDIRSILVKTGGCNDSLTIGRKLWEPAEPYLVSDNVLDAVNTLCLLYNSWKRRQVI